MKYLKVRSRVKEIKKTVMIIKDKWKKTQSI